MRVFLTVLGLSLPGFAQEADESPSRISDKVIPLQTDKVPDRTPPLLELGDPFLGVGPISEGITLPTGAVWTPALQLYGGLRTALQVFDARGQRTSEWASRLDLFANLDLTSTERVLVGFRPLDDQRNFTAYRFEPDETDGWDEELDTNIEVLFFEGDFGELFPRLDPEDSGVLDFGFAVGRQPVIAQDGLLLNDIVDAAGVVRNTLRPSGMSNLRLTGLVAWDDIHRGNNREDDSATLVGLLSEADVEDSTLSLDVLYTFASDRSGDGAYVGASAVQRIGSLNTAIRALGSIATDRDSPLVDSGALLFTELSWTPHESDDLIYLNAFWGIDQFTSAARGPDAGGPLGRVGILYEAVGLGRYASALDDGVDEAVGAALGGQWFFDGTRRQVIIELGARTDTEGRDTSAAAVAGRLQQAVGSRLIVQADLFGSLEEGGDDGYGARVELRIKF